MNSDKINSYLKSDIFWKRGVLSFISIALLYFWYSGMMLNDIFDSPFHYKGSDITYWLFHWMRIPHIILFNKNSAMLFDVTLILSLFTSIAFIDKRGFTIVSGLLLLIYQILFNYKLGYHTHHLFGFQFALLPFYFKKDVFLLAFRFAGILASIAYAFAGFSKFYHKAWMVWHSFSDILQNQHAAYFYFHPYAVRTRFCLWLIEHPGLGFAFFFSAMILQMSFIIGVFTTKFNKVLAVFLLLFHLMDWWMMNLGIFMCMTVLVWLYLFKPAASLE